MNKLKSKIKQLSRAEKIIASVLILLTIFRIFLALKLPLHIQADAVYDDQLFIKYAKDLLAFNWLGSFDQLSLAKGCSFAIFLALNYFIGIPYSFSLITIYILSLIVLCLALSKIIKSKAFLTILYIFLLYFPIMFHDENVQKVYRGGLLAAAAILVVAAFIGLYAQAQAKFRKLLPWSILATISLSFFWFLKEDSIWILPAILVFTAATIYQIFRQNRRVECKIKIQKVLLVAFPFVF